MSTPVPRQYDLVVVGAGSGGYVAGIRAAQLGMTVAIVGTTLVECALKARRV